MKLIGSRWRERVGKPGLIENEQRVVRTLFGLWIVSGEGADAGILSEMPGSVGHQRVGRQLQRQRVAVQKLVNSLIQRQPGHHRGLVASNHPIICVTHDLSL